MEKETKMWTYSYCSICGFSCSHKEPGSGQWPFPLPSKGAVYQLLKAGLHSFHLQYNPCRLVKLCSRVRRIAKLLLWLDKLAVFILHVSLMSIINSLYNLKLYFGLYNFQIIQKSLHPSNSSLGRASDPLKSRCLFDTTMIARFFILLASAASMV